MPEVAIDLGYYYLLRSRSTQMEPAGHLGCCKTQGTNNENLLNYLLTNEHLFDMMIS